MARKFKSMDGNEAAAYVSYAFTEVAGIYPITPSSPMADHVDQWAAQGRKNIFGTPVKVVEMQSEAGAAGTVHGSLGAGALTTTYTASQGLLLMIPNMYKIAGEQLPGVFHVSARTRRFPRAEHLRRSLRRHGLPPDRLRHARRGQRPGGHGPLAGGSPRRHRGQGPVPELLRRLPHLATRSRRSPCWDYEDLAEMCDMDAVQAFRDHALNPEHPHIRGSPRERRHLLPAPRGLQQVYDALPAVVEDYMNKINAKLGTDYEPVQLLRRARCRSRRRVHGLLLRRGSRKSSTTSTLTARRSAWSRFACTVRSSDQALRRRSPRDRQEDRRPRPHQGARLHRRAALPGRRHRSLRGRQDGHQGRRRPLRPRLQGHAARVRVRCLRGAQEGRAQAPVHHRHRR